MAQRDEGLDKLEAFIAAAAETRAALQRDAEKAADVSEEIEDLGDRIDHEMRNLGTTAREIDAEVGPIFQMEMETFWMATMPYTPAAGWLIGHSLAREQRRALITYADALEYEYEHFGEQRQQAAEALEQAAAAAAEAFEGLQEAVRETRADVEPLAEALVASFDAVKQQVIDNLEVD